jgi:hypothetical protein
MKRGLLGCLIVLSASLVSAAAPITLTISHRFGFEPMSVKAKIQIEPHYQNRELCIAAESDQGFARSSCWELNGQYAPITFWYDYKDLPAGRYGVQAVLRRAAGNALVTPILELEVVSAR